MKTRGLICLLPAAILLGATGRLTSANLVANPGFETGNFSGWTTTAASSGSSFGVDNTNPHSGTFAAFFSGAGPFFDHIDQSFVTPPGTTYDLSFWLAGDVNKNPEGFFVNMFRVTWGSTLLVNTNFTSSFAYTQFTFTGLTPDPIGGGSTNLEFGGFNNGGVFSLDDISLTRVSAAVPDSGSSALLLSLGLVGLVLTQSALSWLKIPGQAA